MIGDCLGEIRYPAQRVVPNAVPNNDDVAFAHRSRKAACDKRLNGIPRRGDGGLEFGTAAAGGIAGDLVGWKHPAEEPSRKFFSRTKLRADFVDRLGLEHADVIMPRVLYFAVLEILARRKIVDIVALDEVVG